MAAPDPAVVERQFYVSLLNIVDDGTLSLAELRSLTGGGAYSASAVQAGRSTNVQGLGVSYKEYTGVSGTLTLDGRYSTHSIAMIGNTQVSLANPVEGMTVSIWAVGTGTLTVEGYTVPTNEAIAVYIRNAWQIRIVGASTDTTGPTAGTLDVTTANNTANLTVSGALDLISLADLPYSFRYATTPDGGTTWNYGAWTAYQAGTTYQFTGLTANTSHRFQHRVTDRAGNVTIGGPITKSTTLTPTWTTYAADTFTGLADGTALAGRTTETGAVPYSAVAAALTTATITGLKMERRASGSNIASLAVNAGVQTGVRIEADYEVTSDVQNYHGQVQLIFYTTGAFNNSITANLIHVGNAGVATATLQFQEVAAGNWTPDVNNLTVASTGKLTVEFFPLQRAITIKLNGALLITIAGDTTVTVYGVGFMVNGNANNCAGRLDNIKVEKSDI